MNLLLIVFWRGKMKYLTFSFDDGVLQDKRFVALLNKYNLKATFNINSSLLGLKGCVKFDGRSVVHDKIFPSEVKEVYTGHEVAVHTLTHPNLTGEDKETIIYQVEEDRKRLEEFVGYKIYGMAYPCGGVNNDDRVAEIIKNDTNIKYARTITSSHSFELPTNLYRLNPSVYIGEKEKMFELAKQFIDLKTDREQIFYIWGHAYEFELLSQQSWEIIEEFCKLVSNKKDIIYGTNTEVLIKSGALSL